MLNIYTPFIIRGFFKGYNFVLDFI